MKKILIIVLLMLSCLYQTQAQQLKVASIFGSGMVIQQGINVPLWGMGKADQPLVVLFDGVRMNTVTDHTGNWKVQLPKKNAGGPYELLITNKVDSIQLNDIYVGEVWLASGQSNMQLTLPSVNNAAQEIAEANYGTIRFFTVERNMSSKPLDHVKGSWKTCNSTNAKLFSAAAYFFARDLHLEQKVPVGMIDASWGATPAEAWTSGKALLTHADFKDSVIRYQQLQEDWEMVYRNFLQASAQFKDTNPAIKAPVMPAQKNYPTALYNAMIAPLVPYAVKGVIWYQGEGNAKNAKQYQSLFPLLIKDWRSQWRHAELPFLFVQLAAFKPRNANPVLQDEWASLREAQTMALQLPQTGMAVTIDIGDAKNIHPTNKQDVGKRLYLAARKIAYHLPGEFSGPEFSSMKIKGSEIILRFKHTGKGLMSKEPKLEGFAVAGTDKQFYWANARIKNNTIIVECANVPNPVAVRYAWSSNPPASLYNLEGLPAVPFRTDDW